MVRRSHRGALPDGLGDYDCLSPLDASGSVGRRRLVLWNYAFGVENQIAVRLYLRPCDNEFDAGNLGSLFGSVGVAVGEKLNLRSSCELLTPH